MWEEPRPERLRDRNSDGSRNVLHSMLAYAFILGVAVVLLNSGVIDWRGETGQKPPMPAAEEPFPAPAAAPRSDTGRGRMTVSPDRSKEPPATSTFRPSYGTHGDPAVMQRVTEICRYWTQQNTRGQYSGHQEAACRDMVAYAREHGFPIPAVGGSTPRLPATGRDSYVPPRVNVHVDECERHGYGSVNYRQCRANEQRRLNEWCKSLGVQRDRAQGARRDTLSLNATAVCSAADRYQIVK